MKIDFIAYHSIHAQCGQSVFNFLSKYFECRWVIGPFTEPEAGEGDAAVMLDHRAYHNLYKSKRGYKYLFHLSHDLADINLYEEDKLYDFDLIFVPTTKHYQACIENGYEPKKIIRSGWSKYDLVERNPSWDFMDNFSPNKKTLIYAPSWVINDEWKILLQYFSALDFNIIIKNHPLVDEGQKLPVGQEEEYQKALNAIEEMEQKAKSLGFIIAPRKMNIVELFIHSKASVAVSDVSSCLLEFLPFGTSIETGGGDGPNDASSFSSEVKYIPAESLISLSPDEFCSLINKENKKDSLLNFDLNTSYGELIANNIKEHMTNMKPNIKYKDSKSFYLLKTTLKKIIKKIMLLGLPKIFSKKIFSFVNKK